MRRGKTCDGFFTDFDRRRKNGARPGQHMVIPSDILNLLTALLFNILNLFATLLSNILKILTTSLFPIKIPRLPNRCQIGGVNSTTIKDSLLNIPPSIKVLRVFLRAFPRVRYLRGEFREVVVFGCKFWGEGERMRNWSGG